MEFNNGSYRSGPYGAGPFGTGGTQPPPPNTPKNGSNSQLLNELMHVTCIAHYVQCDKQSSMAISFLSELYR